MLGWVEMITIEPWGTQIKAKLDTGALTSSMHADPIERFERDDEEWVRFTIALEDEATDKQVSKTFERPLYRNVIIKKPGIDQRRPVVRMHICLDGRLLEEQFTLTDRSKMLYPVLLGRRTLEHVALVDPKTTFLSEPRCDEPDDNENDKD